MSEVVYLGSVNHYLVDLDGGGTLTVLRQNLHGSTDQAMSRAAAGSTSLGPTSTSSTSRRPHTSEKETP